MRSRATAYLYIGVGGIVIVLLLVSVLQMRKNKLEPSVWLEHPLGVPTGSVRVLLAILLVFVTVLAANAREGCAIRDIPQWLLTIVGAVIGFYFGNRGLKLANREDTAIDRLESLRALNENGTITDEEFRQKKKDLLLRI
jgi:hypothetical protein